MLHEVSASASMSMSSRTVRIACRSLAGSEQFRQIIGVVAESRLHVLAEDGTSTSKDRFLQGVLEAHQLLVLVVGVDDDLLDQAVKLGVSLAGLAHRAPLGGRVQAFQQQRRALADWPLENRPIGSWTQTVAVSCSIRSRRRGAAQLLGFGAVVEADAVAD